MANTLIAQLNNPAALQQINQRTAAVTSLLLIVACAYLLVKLSWMFLPQDDDAAAPAQQQNRQLINNKQLQQNNFRKLTAASIFGVSDVAPAQQQRAAPETKLNLALRGVLAAIPMELASAIIAKGKNGKEDVFGVGEKMPGGILIKEIHPEHVVLERNGQLEILKLQKISGVGGFSGTGKGKRSSLARSGSSPGAILKDIRSSILKNPTSFAEYAMPVIVKEKGKQIGYRLRPRNKGHLLAEIGLQPNDVIVEINGIKLNKQKSAISALRKLSTAKNLDLVVKRNGTEMPLNITLP